MFADDVYLDVLKNTKGINYATGSYAALCSLESIATFLHGDNPPGLRISTKDLIHNQSQKLSILEVGSGFGTLTRLLIKVFDNPIICFELDPSCIKKLYSYKNSLSMIDQSRITITNNLRHFMPNSNNSVNHFGIIIDGPILPKELYRSIRQSPHLRFVFIERYRLIQRVLTSYFLFRCGFQQQYLETRHNKKVTGAFFIVDVCADKIFSRKVRALGDFVITSLHLYPKFLKNLAQSKGRNIKVGTYKENSMGITQKIKK